MVLTTGEDIGATSCGECWSVQRLWASEGREEEGGESDESEEDAGGTHSDRSEELGTKTTKSVMCEFALERTAGSREAAGRM